MLIRQKRLHLGMAQHRGQELRRAALRRLFARLRLRVNEAKSAVLRVGKAKFLDFSFWFAPGGKVKRREARKALDRMKDRVREITRRSAGLRLESVCAELGRCLKGWKAYFQLAEDRRVRHRLRVLQLKQWKRGTTVYRELRARGMSDLAARRVAANGRRWWHNSAMAIHMALPNVLFVKFGVPRLGT